MSLKGTYPLPEAQLDRFLLNPVIDYLSVEDEIKMVGATTGERKSEPEAIISGEEVLKLQEITRQIPASETVISYAVATYDLCVSSKVRNCDEWTKKRVRWKQVRGHLKP